MSQAPEMAESRFTLWRTRALRLWLAGGTVMIGAVGSIARNKWLAIHLGPDGLGVFGQVVAGQTWLGTGAGLGLGVPLALAVAAAAARGDTAAVRRAVWTALGILRISITLVLAIVLVWAEPIATLLLGSREYALLVRLSAVAIAGLALQGSLQGLFAGYSDVRAPLTYTFAGNLVMLAAILLLVPRFGVTGAIAGNALLWPTAITVSLWIHRAAYRPAFRPAPKPWVDRVEARAFLRIALTSLALALLDQGTLLGLRAHYLRAYGLAANGQLQVALAMAQQAGGVFYSYLGSYAFGKVSGAGDAQGIRDYTHKQSAVLVATAALAFACAMLLAGPLIHLFYTRQFDAARPLMMWTLFGEFAKVAMQVWALGALPLGGVRLLIPIGITYPLALAIGYAAAHALGLGRMALPSAYAAACCVSLGVSGALMSARGVPFTRRGMLVLVVALAGLAALAVLLR